VRDEVAFRREFFALPLWAHLRWDAVIEAEITPGYDQRARPEPADEEDVIRPVRLLLPLLRSRRRDVLHTLRRIRDAGALTQLQWLLAVHVRGRLLEGQDDGLSEGERIEFVKNLFDAREVEPSPESESAEAEGEDAA
jgi:hypothetical protein